MSLTINVKREQDLALPLVIIQRWSHKRQSKLCYFLLVKIVFVSRRRFAAGKR